MARGVSGLCTHAGVPSTYVRDNGTFVNYWDHAASPLHGCLLPKSCSTALAFRVHESQGLFHPTCTVHVPYRTLPSCAVFQSSLSYPPTTHLAIQTRARLSTFSLCSSHVSTIHAVHLRSTFSCFLQSNVQIFQAKFLQPKT